MNLRDHVCISLVLTFASSLCAAPTTTAPVAFTLCETGAGPAERIDATYQWSLPMLSPQFERRAYLWIPPGCQRVRGVIVGLQNMLEKLMFQNGDFRDACAAADLGILYIAPGSVSTHNDDPALALGFKDPKEGSRQLQELLSRFANDSGYSEVEFAPLITVGHSAATPFVWGYTATNPQRVIASIPYKGWIPGGGGKGVPTLYTTSEWAEVGGPNWGSCWQKDFGAIIRLREKSDLLLGASVEIGNGHYAWQPASGKILGMFITKAVAERLPTDSPTDSLTTLKTVVAESGVLVDPQTLGRTNFKAVPYNDYPGEKKSAFWYIDREMASTINDYMASRLAKTPQVIDIPVNGKPALLGTRAGGTVDFHPTLLDDGVTWKIQACFLNEAPSQLGYGDSAIGHATAQTYFRCGSGALKQVGPDTFRVWLGRGGVERQGNPWDPWIIATNPGDETYRSTDRPIHVLIDIKRKDGTPQTIDFPQISTQMSDAKSLQLKAIASSGLPVQFFVVSGPVQIKGEDTLEFMPIPPRAKFPLHVQIGAFQWGRGGDDKIQSAGPQIQEFLIEK
jgi:hypothetical protein